MTEDEERGLLEWLLSDAIWTPTTYIQPHEYIVRKDHGELFALMEAHIEKAGYEAPFQGRVYRYADLGDHRYWLMGVVLNRAGTSNIKGEAALDRPSGLKYLETPIGAPLRPPAGRSPNTVSPHL